MTKEISKRGARFLKVAPLWFPVGAGLCWLGGDVIGMFVNTMFFVVFGIVALVFIHTERTGKGTKRRGWRAWWRDLWAHRPTGTRLRWMIRAAYLSWLGFFGSLALLGGGHAFAWSAVYTLISAGATEAFFHRRDQLRQAALPAPEVTNQEIYQGIIDGFRESARRLRASDDEWIRARADDQDLLAEYFEVEGSLTGLWTAPRPAPMSNTTKVRAAGGNFDLEAGTEEAAYPRNKRQAPPRRILLRGGPMAGEYINEDSLTKHGIVIVEAINDNVYYSAARKCVEVHVYREADDGIMVHSMVMRHYPITIERARHFGNGNGVLVREPTYPEVELLRRDNIEAVQLLEKFASPVMPYMPPDVLHTGLGRDDLTD